MFASLLLMSAFAAEPDPMDDGATALSRLSRDEASLRTCEVLAAEEAARGALDAVVRVWSACAERAAEAGLSELVPRLNGMRILAEVERDHGSVKAGDPQRYARVVLITVAANPEADFPPEVVQAHWLKLMSDVDARQNLQDVRTVALRWTPGGAVDPTLAASIEAHCRRYIGDMGFKLAPSGSADEGRADILVSASAAAQALTPRVVDGKGLLYVEEISISTRPVKYRSREATGAPLAVSRSAMHSAAGAAREEAAEAAGEALAQALLAQVVRELFAGQAPPVD